MKIFRTPLYIIVFLLVAISCNNPQEHIAPAVRERDSVAMMTSYGINTLISDSGVMKYRIVAERWEVNTTVHPPRWIFSRGLFLEQFDEKLHVEAYIQSDTAYYFTEQRLWHLIGNVRVRTITQMRFNSEELYWDENQHEMYSNKFSRVVTPEREMQGSYFRSDERMTHYTVTNSKGSFIKSDVDKKDENAETKDSANNQPLPPKRQPTMPRSKSIQ